jgi:predicted MFS family arabinose efflux permease
MPLAMVAAGGVLSLAVAMGIGRFAFTPLLPQMLREGLLDVEQAGWIAAANYMGYLVGAVTAARMPLRPATLAVAGLLGTAALTAAMAWPASTLWLPLRFLAGVASAWVFVATSVWCLGALASRGADAASGWVYAGVGVGIVLAGALCLVAATAGVRSRSLWLQMGGLALLLAGPVLWVIARLPSSLATTRGATARGSPAQAAGTVGLVVCYGAMGFGYILPATFLPVLARSVVDDPLVFGLAWPVFGATAALSTLVGVRALRAASRLWTWAACQLAMGLGVLLPALWTNVWTITVSAVLVGGTFMVITLAAVQEMRARAPAEASRHVGRITAAFALGQVAGPAVSSLLLHTSANGVTLALGTGALALLGTGAWLLAAASRTTDAQEVLHG